VTLSEESSLVKGEAVAAMVYNGDALVLQQQHPELAYFVPPEGSILWVDYLVIMRESPNKALAHAFINYLNAPERAARLAEFLRYASPNAGADAFLDGSHREDPRIYPPPEVMSELESYKELSSEAIKERNEIFSRLVP